MLVFYNNTHQLWLYISPPSWASFLSCHPIPLDLTEQEDGLPVLHSNFPPSILPMIVCMLMLLCQVLPPFPSPTVSPSPGSIPANIPYVLPAQLHWILCNPMDCSPLGSSVHGILQVRTLESVAIPFSRGPSWPKDQTWFSWIAGRFLPLNYKGSISIPSLKIGSLISFF